MTRTIMPEGRSRYLDNENNPAIGCLLYTYAAGTSTPKAAYTDPAGTVPHLNPIVLDEKGEALIYFFGSYKIDLKTAAGAQITGYPVDSFETPLMAGDMSANTGTSLITGTWFGSVVSALSNLGTSIGTSLIGFLQAGVGAVAWSAQAKLRDSLKSPKDYGATGDGVTNDTAAFTLCRTATGGRYYIGPGNYVVDAVPDVWADPFIAGDGVTLTIAAAPFTVSNGITSGWRTTTTQRYMTWKHSRTGADVVIWSDGELSSDSHRIFLPWDIRRDSHSMLFAPGTNGGNCDVLWRRSALNADAFGNRHSFTFDEAADSFQLSYATSASGAPAFDGAFKVIGGASATLEFIALQPRFSQGIKITTRTNGNFELVLTPAADRVHLQDVGAVIRHMTFKNDGAVGFFGSGGTTKPDITGSRGGNAALASLLTALSAMGLVTDSTTA